LCGCPIGALAIERTIALELERMAMHIADTGALSMDVAYQLGQVACEALRTMTINTTQAWCGNRFGKGLIRPCGTNKPLTQEKIAMIRTNVAEIRRRYNEVIEDIKSSPSLLARFEQCGIVPKAEMQRIGGVGMAARSSGVKRDIRSSHPYAAYASQIKHESIVKPHGDVMSRLMMRCREVLQSADYIEQLLSTYAPSEIACPDYEATLKAEALAFSLVEGWRGEICHVAITDKEGKIATYKIKDPSLHNWLALAIAVRGEGISDFPICNKSFNLSYCGHDL
jgi:Ni,Fe-hydrogenase III large subunit